MTDPSAGELGGIFAGVIALLATIGGGLRWSLNWTERRASTRSAKLDAWQKELDLREKRLDDEQTAINDDIRRRLTELEKEAEEYRKQVAALLGGYQILAAELRMIKPDSDALPHADELLRSVFPIDPTTPAGMVVLLSKTKRKDEEGEQ